MQNTKLWFRRKRYGYGWYPNGWEGWLVVLIYLVTIIKIFILIDPKQHSGSDTLINFAPPYIIVTVILIAVCRLKGEKPQWSWGSWGEDKDRV